MIFVVWCSVWTALATHPIELLIPSLAIVARARYLGRRFLPGLVGCVWLFGIAALLGVFRAKEVGSASGEALLGAFQLPVTAACLYQVLPALGEVNVRGVALTFDKLGTVGRFIGPAVAEIGIAVVVFERALSVLGKGFRHVFAHAIARVRVCDLNRDRAWRLRKWDGLRVFGAAISQSCGELVRTVSTFSQLRYSMGVSLPSPRSWAVGGRGAIVRPVADSALLVGMLLAAITFAGSKGVEGEAAAAVAVRSQLIPEPIVNAINSTIQFALGLSGDPLGARFAKSYE